MTHLNKTDWFYLVMAAVFLTATFLVLESSRHHFFLNDDNADEFLPLLIHSYDCLATTGEFDQVNYYQTGGEPVVEQGLPGVFYPPYYLAGFLARAVTHDAKWTVEWSVFIHWFPSLLFFYIWLKSYGLKEYLCCLGAINWVMSPFYLTIESSWETLSIIQCFIPATFLFAKELKSRCSPSAVLGLAISIASLILVGTIQYVVYIIPLLIIYLVNSGLKFNRFKGFIYAAVVMLIIILPEYLPMSHASSHAILRDSRVFRLSDKLQWYLDPPDFILTQYFGYGILHTKMSLCFLCLECYLFFPLLTTFKSLNLEQGKPIRLLIWISLIALLFSTAAHAILFMLPIFGMFRWPFKVFTLFKFFFLSATLLLSSAYLSKSRVNHWRLVLVSAWIVIPIINLFCLIKDINGVVLSDTRIDGGKNLQFLRLLNIENGRVMGVGPPEDSLELENYLGLNYCTYYRIPNIGGYNPLVSEGNFRYEFGILYPKVLRVPILELPRDAVNQKSVRYWLINPKSDIGYESIDTPGTQIIYRDPNLVVLENLQAFPMISDENHNKVGSFSYFGNSMKILLSQPVKKVCIPLAPSDGWWYRLDNGPWKRPGYADDRIICDTPGSKEGSSLEVKYFDPRVKTGCIISLILIALLATVVTVDSQKTKFAKPSLA